MNFYMKLPRFARYLHYLWVKYVKRDDIWAGLLKDFGPKTAAENWKLVSKREAFKETWKKWWGEQEMDVLLCVPNATPAVPHGGMKDAVSSCGYTFLFNLVSFPSFRIFSHLIRALMLAQLDYTAGILPVTHVDRVLDQLPPSFNIKALNGVAKGAYKHYDASKMGGLPIAVQVVGQRLEEEKVLSVMKRCEDALERNGGKYDLLEVE